MQRLRVEVTEDDIAEGEIADCGHCPIALAVRAVVGSGYDVEVVHLIKIQSRATRTIVFYDMPDEAHYFINGFDSEHEVEPFEFEARFRACGTVESTDKKFLMTKRFNL